jgi:hypothetical protein
MPNNDQFKTVLHDARLICRSKFNAVKAIHGENNTEVVNIQNDLKDVYRQFDNPAVWTQSLTYDHMEVMNLILKVGVADPNDLANFLKVTKELLDVLEEEVLKDPLEKIREMQPSDWNVKVLNAMRRTHQRIAGREVYFRNRGQDPHHDPEYVTMDTNHKEKAAEYRILLNTNGVQSTESDEILISGFGELIKKSEVYIQFKGLYKGYADFIVTKIPTA